MSFFPDPRRIVTGHDDNGNSIILKDSRIPCEMTGMSVPWAVLWETDKFPADNNGSDDPTDKQTQSLANKNGVVLRVVDIPPRTNSAFHRTVSLDFGMLFEGELDCHLDNGVKIHMKPGDVCVQRGTIHGWENPTDKPARIYFVLVAANPVEISGKQLSNAGFSDHETVSGGRERTEGD
ncbi:hypothetical protein AOQ84DRAFT_314229 [Glonium stellatum]|uniref:Cupin type-2 domain-containing protein n=1 Tax=Glonium stellatum TaxID=574774 RepID=A0A8E2F607_9PEZI|nr:hypothetical protein AOQ84DRAFT_314229 [Glonium stellatum]